MNKSKGINKKDNTEVNEFYDDNLDGARQVRQNIQDLIDEWWENDHLTEEQQIRKNELFPNEKPSADEFILALVKHARKDPKFKKLKEEAEKKERKRQIIKDVLLGIFIFLSLLLVTIHISIMKKMMPINSLKQKHPHLQKTSGSSFDFIKLMEI